MELEQYIVLDAVRSLRENKEPKNKNLQEEEVLILKYYHDSYIEKNKMGSLDAYIQLRGWANIFNIFGGYAGFAGAMAKAGYTRVFIWKKKKEWQKLFNEKVGD